MQEGRIEKVGSFAECARLLGHIPGMTPEETQLGGDAAAASSAAQSPIASPTEADPGDGSRRRKKSENASKNEGEKSKSPSENGLGTLVKAEKREAGTVQLAVWRAYVEAMGWLGFATAISFVIVKGLEVASQVWLAVWADATKQEQASIHMYLIIYTALSLAAVIGVIIQSVAVYAGVLHAAKRLHDRMLLHILHAPTSFFDATPIGRILNR